nr:D-aminoacylase [Micromonospora sp. DSM 115978]
MYDLVIRGGTVFDGRGSEGVAADVAISAGVVVEVGTVRDSAARTVDAAGRFVSPGFVDGHT